MVQLGELYTNLNYIIHMHFHVCIMERCGRVNNCVVAMGTGEQMASEQHPVRNTP